MGSVVKMKCPQTPIVLYINGNGGLLEQMKGTGVDVNGLNWAVDMADGRKPLGSDDISIQGNVDHAYLFSPLPALEDEIKSLAGLYNVQGQRAISSIWAMEFSLVRLAHFFNVARSSEYDTHVASYSVGGASNLVA